MSKPSKADTVKAADAIHTTLRAVVLAAAPRFVVSDTDLFDFAKDAGLDPVLATCSAFDGVELRLIERQALSTFGVDIDITIRARKKRPTERRVRTGWPSHGSIEPTHAVALARSNLDAAELACRCQTLLDDMLGRFDDATLHAGLECFHERAHCEREALNRAIEANQRSE